MAKLIKPLFFSKHFGLPPLWLESRNILDPILNADTKLFIDPLLLSHSKEKLASDIAFGLLRQRFGDIIKLLMASKRPGDPASLAAAGLLDLSERRETCLGFGGSGVSGSSRPDELKMRILRTTREIVEIGVNDPELISLMGFLEDDVGPDTISDLATNAIFPALVELTQRVCKEHNIRCEPVTVGRTSYQLPINPIGSGKHGVVLVPNDILRELPIATDISEVSQVAFENQQIRDHVNALIADFARATVREKKRVLKKAALESAEQFLDILDGLRGADTPYDVGADPAGIYTFRKAIRTIAADYPLQFAQITRKSGPELMRVVKTIIAQFKQLIENQGLDWLLWHGNEPRNEKAAQLVFYGIAESYCAAFNVDVSPETNGGGGPVDFKFSTGYAGRCVAEVKLSTGRVVHGYATQLPTYQAAVPSADAIYIVVNVGKMGRKLATIQKMRAERVASGGHAPEIHVIDATKKPSASKRR
jgi:hypothetical protein